MKRISIRINILTHFIFLILFSALLLLSIQYYFSTRSAMEASEQNFHSMFERVQYRIFSLNQQNRTILELLQQHPYLQETPVPTDKLLPIFCESLSQFPEAYAVYLATGEDNFFEVVNMGHSSLLERQLHAPSETAWTVIKVYPGKEENNYHFQYYNTNHDLLGETFKTTDYKASERPWFRNALKTSEIYQSKPYMFWHLKAPGVTLSKQINSDSVLAIDYTIEHLAQLFERLKPTQDSQVVLFNALGEKYFETDVRPEFIKLAMNGFALNKTEKEYIQSLPLLKVSNQSDWEPFDFVRNGNAGGFSVALIKSLAQQIGFDIQFVNGYTWDEILEEFQQGRIDILHSLLHTPERESMGIFTRPYYPIDNYIITRAETKQVTELAQLKQLRFALGKGWQSTNLLLDNFPDLDYKLYDGLPAMMRAVSSGEVDALIDNADTFARNKLKFQIEDIKLNQKLERFITRGNNLYFLLQDKYAPLVTILNRALDSIDPKSLRELRALSRKLSLF